MATIKLENIQKSFGNTQVLGGVSLDINDGEFLTLVGPSGCGKSTLLRIIAGLETPDEGDIKINDQIVNNQRAAARNLAMVFQSYALYPHLTVADNMMTPLKLRDLNFWQRMPILGPVFSRPAYKALFNQVRETAEILKIEQLLDRKPGQLSGGQRQRAALGRAMVRQPVAFLMDEPLSNLDAALRVHMRSELSALHRSLNTTFIYVTHDQAEALTMSNRMAVMMNGQILQLGTPTEIYENPANIQVAEFVGSPKINILPAYSDSEGIITCFDTVFEKTIADSSQTEIQIGIRAEDLEVITDPALADFHICVKYKENLGADIYLHAVIEKTDTPIIVRANPEKAVEISIGDKIFCKYKDNKALAFSKTGDRIYFDETMTHQEAQVA